MHYILSNFDKNISSKYHQSVKIYYNLYKTPSSSIPFLRKKAGNELNHFRLLSFIIGYLISGELNLKKHLYLDRAGHREDRQLAEHLPLTH